ncbi:MAG: YkgJ family cysteine cluster protein [Candidatus Protochlamydia sp.]|nr:YkgJ family cysteine cluster protein [Candidatus Protochlamydia sp.]
MLKVIQDNPIWYEKGLTFECTGCGACCTGSPGYIWVNEEEITAIATHLNLSIQDFSHKYLRLVHGRLSLLEDPKSYDCIFLKDKKCQIYALRPVQCRTFPWWPTLLDSEESWKKASYGCEGISRKAPLVPFEKIEEQVALQKEKGYLHDENS